MKHKLNPLQQFVLFLSIYAIAAISQNPYLEVFIHLGATVGFSLVLFYIFTKLFKKKKNVWNTLATALIMFLVLDFGTDIAGFAWDSPDLLNALLAMLIAMVYKFFFEYKGKPIINPVVFAILLLASILALFPEMKPPFASWWGASFSEPFTLVLILAWIAVGVKTWRKWPLLLSFLAAYAAYSLIYQSVEYFQFFFSTATLYFIAAVMLIEPKTSPIKTNHQIICGIVAGMTYGFVLNYGALVAIAVMNLCNFVLTQLPKKKAA